MAHIHEGKGDADSRSLHLFEHAFPFLMHIVSRWQDLPSESMRQRHSSSVNFGHIQVHSLVLRNNKAPRRYRYIVINLAQLIH